jgi:hypothetical protein
MDDVLALDGVGQAEAILAGDVTAGELVAAAIARIDERNPELNAVIHRFDDRARRETTTPTDGPFGGVPFLVKDAVCHTAGDPYHFGMQFLKERNWTEDHDTWLAGRFRAAGFVFVGKTNTAIAARSGRGTMPGGRCVSTRARRCRSKTRARSRGTILLFICLPAHDFSGKSVPTFPDRALRPAVPSPFPHCAGSRRYCPYNRRP